MEGRRHGRGWGGVRDAGGCGGRTRRHVPTSGGCRRGAGGEGWESHLAGRCGSCFTCGSRVAAIPPRAAMRSHASGSALWRTTTMCHSAPRQCVVSIACSGNRVSIRSATYTYGLDEATTEAVIHAGTKMKPCDRVSVTMVIVTRICYTVVHSTNRRVRLVPGMSVHVYVRIHDGGGPRFWASGPIRDIRRSSVDEPQPRSI